MLTPIKTNKWIESTYVKIDPQDTVITNFETSKQVKITGTTGWPNSENPHPNINRFSEGLGSGIQSFICSVTGSLSSHYNSVAMSLFSKNLDKSMTGNSVATCKDIGVLSVKKRNFDYAIEKGSIFLTATGSTAAVLGGEDIEGDYYDDGLGNLVRASNQTNIGVVDYETGMMVVTASPLREIAISVTSVSFSPRIKNTNISVFCTAYPDELNFSTNHTFLATASLSSTETAQGYNNLYTSLPITAGASGMWFDQRFYESDPDFKPYITSIGLYDDNNECLAIAKLTKPIQKPSNLPLTFKVSIDI